MNEIGDIIRRDLVADIEEKLNRVGILHRIFSRCKGVNSAREKIKIKGYETSGKKVQDYIGIRIATYFIDDIPLIIQILESTFAIDNKQIDVPEGEYFGPVRTNLVFKIPSNWESEFTDYYSTVVSKIDSTFEVQIRTILSEGWHEIEHDLRYKCKEDWVGQEDLSRHLNGIYATLETSDTSLLDLFDKMSFRNYKEKKWQALIRNKLRLRMKNIPLSEEVMECLNSNLNLGKEIFKLDRKKLVETIFYSGIKIPNLPDNFVFLINHIYINDPTLESLTPELLKENMERMLNKELVPK